MGLVYSRWITLVNQITLSAPISEQKMEYNPGHGIVVQRIKKNGKKQVVTFSARDGLAALSTPIPNKWEPMVHSYGFYSNRRRGERKQKNPDQPIQVKKPEDESEFQKACRSHWARLIKRVQEVDPWRCPQCGGKMKIVSCIEDPAVIKRILSQLGLWKVVPRGKRAPPKPPPEITLDYSLF